MTHTKAPRPLADRDGQPLAHWPAVIIDTDSPHDPDAVRLHSLGRVARITLQWHTPCGPLMLTGTEVWRQPHSGYTVSWPARKYAGAVGTRWNLLRTSDPRALAHLEALILDAVQQLPEVAHAR